MRRGSSTALNKKMKTIIIGNGGSGKTWLAKKIASTEVQIIHLDNLFWLPGGFDEKRGKEEVNQLIVQSKTHDNWIVEGVFGELAKQYFDKAETLIWLDIPWDVCRSRLQQRGSESKKHMGRKQSEGGLIKLIEWASHYYDRTDFKSYSGHQSLFNFFQGNKVQLKSEDEVNLYIQSVQQGAAPDSCSAAI